MNGITSQRTESFREFLIQEEKSVLTVKKYVNELKAFAEWLGSRKLTKAEVLEYKKGMAEKYQASSVNSKLSALNKFFLFECREDCCVRLVRVQRRVFIPKEKELSKEEYEKLLQAAYERKDKRLCLLMQTICSTGIRISELKYITVRAVCEAQANIACKGKLRAVILTTGLCERLKEYIIEKNIEKGPVFVTRSGKPIDRSNIWADMKKLCDEAGVSRAKVYPHNLRHLFARTYYSVCRDIVRLADILGHSNINTTRIYMIETGDTHRRQMQMLDLLK